MKEKMENNFTQRFVRIKEHIITLNDESLKKNSIILLQSAKDISPTTIEFTFVDKDLTIDKFWLIKKHESNFFESI